MVESSALLKRRTSKGYRGFESLPHRHLHFFPVRRLSRRSLGEGGFDWWGASRARVRSSRKTIAGTLRSNHWFVDAAGVAGVPLTEAAGVGIVTIS